jgi:hypothetical protein
MRPTVPLPNQFAANVLPIVRTIQASGITSLAGIAEALIARGVRTARGGDWRARARHGTCSAEQHGLTNFDCFQTAAASLAGCGKTQCLRAVL